MSESVYDRCQRTPELFEGGVPCQIGFRPAFSALLILLGHALIARIRQRSVVQVRLGPLALQPISPRRDIARIIRELRLGLGSPSLNINQPDAARRPVGGGAPRLLNPSHLGRITGRIALLAGGRSASAKEP
jgi:hypothetical protein